MGYIGSPTALLFSNNSNTIVGVDVNERIVKSRNEKKMPFGEEGFQELLDSAIEKGLFRAGTEVEEADVFLVAVPTPLDKETKLSDLTYVSSACEMIVPHLKKWNYILPTNSTAAEMVKLMRIHTVTSISTGGRLSTVNLKSLHIYRSLDLKSHLLSPLLIILCHLTCTCYILSSRLIGYDVDDNKIDNLNY